MKHESPPNCDVIAFRPYYHLKYLIVFCIFLICGYCFIAYILDWTDQSKIGLLFPLSCLFFGVYQLSCLLFVRIQVDDHGILLENPLLNQHIQYVWSQYGYGYYVFNSKGYEYLLLSQKQLTEKDQKSALRRSVRVFHKLPANYASFTCLPVFLNWFMPNLKADIERIARNHVNLR